MKNTRNYLVSLFVLSLLALPCGAYALGVEAGVGYWQQTPTGTVSYQPLTGTDNLDLKDDLLYGSTGKPMVRVKVDTPLFLPNVYFMATPMSYSGEGKKSVSFDFGGKTYTSTQPFQSKVKMDHYDLALYYTFFDKLSLGKIAVDLGLNARMMNFEASISNSLVGEASKTLSLLVPMAYGAVIVSPIKAFSIEAEARGVAYGENHYFDFIGRVKVKPIGPLFIAGGYRTEQIKIETENVKTDVKFSGPFAEAGISF